LSPEEEKTAQNLRDAAKWLRIVSEKLRVIEEKYVGSPWINAE
jgi:hypothetical protein